MHWVTFNYKLMITLCHSFSFQAFKKLDADKKQQDLDKMKAKYGLSTPETQSQKK